jgi:hypothetical protein
MPTVFISRRYRFFFFSNDESEPRHVHIESGDNHAKFWLEPIQLAKVFGFNSKELNEILDLIEENAKIIEEKWNAHFNR